MRAFSKKKTKQRLSNKNFQTKMFKSRRIVKIEQKRAAIEKSRALIGWEKIDERVSFVYNL